MKRQIPFVLLGLWLCLSSGCDRFRRKDNPSPVEQLPPETQTGAGTFGCLVSGKPWTPKGFNGTPNFSPNLVPNGGVFSISTYRKDGDTDQAMNMGIKNLTSVGTYPFIIDNTGLIFYDTDNCGSFQTDNSQSQGYFEITKYDMANYIVSGRFNAKLYKAGCDTLRITDGRFDIKFN
jgi:hypothetical protein